MSKVYVTWEEVEKFVHDVEDYLTNEGINITGVYGLPRGGLITAVMLSHKLNVPMLMAPCDGCLIVDDIADSGRSLIHYTDNDTQFNKFTIATMYYHERSVVKPNFYKWYKGDDWIVFPWEIE